MVQSSYDIATIKERLLGEQKTVKKLWEQIDWKALQAFIAVLTLPAMVVFGSITILLFNP
ncbi:hypothetical protein MCEMIE24B_00334 [Microbacteriaceae bacterium]